MVATSPTQIRNPQSAIRNQGFGYGDYLRFGKLLLDRCGLHFSERRRTELELGIRHAFAASTCKDLDEYYTLLQDSEASAMEMDRLINAVTVNETHFFRNTAQFDALYYHVLPQIIERKRHSRMLRIWSAGCASGEESYSIAILLRELLPDADEWAITILGTDINTEALERARKATYGGWAFREARATAWRPRYFRPQGKRYELIPEVRRIVTFARLNLAEPCYPSYQTNTTLMDLILCRNVTIYFSQHVTLQVAERLYNALVEGGWLVVGHSEPSLDVYHRFQTRNFPNAILYQREAISDFGFRISDFRFQTSDSTPQPAQPVSSNQYPIPGVQQPATLALSKAEGSNQLPATSNLQSPTSNLQSPPPDPQFAIRDPQSAIEHAQELLEYGRSEEARAMLLGLVRSKPDAPTCALLGQAYANLGNWRAAEEWCRKAIGLDKLTLEAYYTLALVLQHQAELTQAIDMMKKVVYLDRTYVLGHFGLANLYRENGQLPQAQKSLDNARRLLNGGPADKLIPSSGGITLGRLREAIIRQQQAWGEET